VRENGVLDLMTPEDTSAHATFWETYERVRSAEGWGSGDMDLPFRPRRHRAIWEVRRRTFLRLEKLVCEEVPRGRALDVGAGNCWLTRYLARWGFDATAIDVNAGAADGLAAAGTYIEQGDRFERVRAPMERLPFEDGVFDLVVANGSLHYSTDLAATLAGFARVMTPGATAVVLDSPWFDRAADAERAMAEARAHLVSAHGVEESLAGRSSCFVREPVTKLLLEQGWTVRHVGVWPGWSRSRDAWRAWFRGQRIAAFPLVVLRRSG
jgi:SAM-dependent methyltransferase